MIEILAQAIRNGLLDHEVAGEPLVADAYIVDPWGDGSEYTVEATLGDGARFHIEIREDA